jgi:Glucose dehydrogenase
VERGVPGGPRHPGEIVRIGQMNGPPMFDITAAIRSRQRVAVGYRRCRPRYGTNRAALWGDIPRGVGFMGTALHQTVQLSVSACLIGIFMAGCGGREGAGGKQEGQGKGATSMTASQADSAMRSAMADSAEWPSYGRDYTNQRYSPLTQVTPANVKDLKLAWSYRTGVPHAFETSPIVLDGVMYITTPLDHVVALDAKTGTKKWEYAPQLGPTVHCCGPVNRGAAVYAGKVYIGQLDGKLVALNASDGSKAWEVQVGDPMEGYSLTGPPVGVDGKIITGVSGAEYGIRGYVTAYDANSGSQVWRFYTIPSPEEGGWWGTWATKDAYGTTVHRSANNLGRADSAKYADAWKTGGGSMWQAVAVDRELGLVFFTVGNPSPDLDGAMRPGDNLYTESIVAINLKDGKHKWHMQQVPHDVWDLDATSPTVLVDVKGEGGQTVKAVGQAGKTGWVYLVDRATGKPLRKSDAFVPQANMFAAPTTNGTRMLPGANGGSEWSPPAVDPKLGYMYVLGLHQPMMYLVRPGDLAKPALWLGGAFVGTGEPQYGLFSAVDLNTGKIAWQKKVADPMIGGALATGGGVVFTGTADKHFLAYDSKSGEQLWSYTANAGVNAPPISYAIDGQQYIAVAAGGNYQINAPRGDELLTFSLGGTGGARSTSADTTHRGAATSRTGGN